VHWKNTPPIKGISRVKTYFAWRPAQVKDEKVWLQRYYEIQWCTNIDTKVCANGRVIQQVTWTADVWVSNKLPARTTDWDFADLCVKRTNDLKAAADEAAKIISPPVKPEPLNGLDVILNQIPNT
jgi:hypothetical protein